MSQSTLTVAPFDTLDGRGLSAAVRRFRSRARVVIFVNQIVTACVVAAAATMIWNLVWASTGRDRWTALTVSLAAAVLAAALLTYLRTPSLSATAATMDQRMRLQDRIVAGLQVAHEADPVSALVIRDAGRSLRTVRPADVFPLHAGARAIIGALLMIGALVSVTVDVSRVVSSRPTGAGAGAGSLAMARPDGSVEAMDARIEAPPADTRSDTRTDDTTAAPATGTEAPNPTPESTSDDSGDRPGLPPDAADAPDVPPVSPSPVAPDDAETPSRMARPDVRSVPERSSSSRGGGAGADGQATASVSLEAAPGAMPAGAGGSNLDAQSSKGYASGGVASGNLGVALSRDASGSSRIAASPVGSRGAARAQAEAVMSRDDIPPARRRFVRDYFLRLQSSGHPQ